MADKNSVRKCEIAQQIQFLPGFPDRWRETLEANLEKEPNIKTWAYILHDKDTKDDNTPKEHHVHIAIELNESVKFSTVGGYVGVPAQYVTYCKQRYKAGRKWYADIGGLLSYMTHRNAPDRYQYDDSEVIAKPGYDWIAARAKSEERQEKLKSTRRVLEGIELGEIHRYDIFDYVSQSVYIDNKPTFDRAFEYYEGRLKNSDNHRSLDVIFISGKPGSGKTSLAKKYCEDKKLSYCVSASSRDPLQDYEGQEALILDDLRPEVLPLSDLLKLLDNNTVSSASARYHDRWIQAKTIIITTVLSIEEFFDRIGQRDEPLAQLKRRCKILIQLSHDRLDMYAYRASIGDYVMISSGTNPIIARYPETERETSEEELIAICKDFGLQYRPEGLPSDYVTDDNPFVQTAL